MVLIGSTYSVQAEVQKQEDERELGRLTAWLGRAAMAVLRASTALLADEALLLPLRRA